MWKALQPSQDISQRYISKLNGEAAQVLSVGQALRSKNSTKVSPVVTSSYLRRPTSKGSQCEREGGHAVMLRCVSAGLDLELETLEPRQGVLNPGWGNPRVTCI